MKNKSTLVLVIAAAIFLIIAFVLSRNSASPTVATNEPVKPKKPPVVFPRDKKPRPSQTAPLATARPAIPGAKPEVALDSMQRALLGPNNRGAIFVEANAIRHSPLVEKMLRCRANDLGNGLSEMKDALGIDLLEDVDRIGFDGNVFVANGFFKDMKVPEKLGEGTAYGDSARIWEAKDDDGKQMFFARQADGMLLTAQDESEVKAAIDRAEGRSESNAAALPKGAGQGEIYGNLGKDFLQSMLGDTNDPAMQQIADLVLSSAVRMNVDEDAALSLDLQAVDSNAAEQLSKLVIGGVALMRTRATAEGDTELASLLEQARVGDAGNGRFDVDLAVPGDLLLKGMGCGPDGTPLDAAPVAKP